MQTIAALALLACSALQTPQEGTIADKTKGLTAREGLIESFLDVKQGKVLLKFGRPDESGKHGEYLYIESLATGLGSNDLGIDRSGFGNTFVIEVKSIGPKVVFEAPNLSYRALTSNPDEIRAVREGFASSILWAGTPVARDADGSVLVDISEWLVRDAHGVARSLTGFSLDRNRSVIDFARAKAFPNNLEFDVVLTFAAAAPSPAVGDHAPDASAVTLVQRHSIVKLPEPGFKARKFDTRSGSFTAGYVDFAAPLGEPIRKLFIARHRLEKTDPGQATSPVKKPIVYYVDRGVPEPMRTALIEGGNYWARAFEAAGFTDAFRVELMPEGIDPLDVRYNVIQWMNRSTRGWAYGQSVVDPRTGEIIKGAVNLDSQRARQDILIFEGLLGVDETGKGGPNDPIRVAMARIRQLSAHEIGHTLGFQHNFAASVNGRASVMDYPSPRIRIDSAGAFDLTQAYAPGLGDWDMQVVRYAYTEFAPGTDEAAALNRIILDGIAKGLVFLADGDANEADGASPRTNRWDDGTDPIEGLRHSTRIRRLALSRFGERNIRMGQPIAQLEMVLGPLYFFHRYDVDSTAKLIGGVDYRHAVRGDGQTPQTVVPAARQREALAALLTCVDPDFLDVPDSIRRLLGPRANGYPSSREAFRRSATYVFDTLTVANTAADLVFAPLLNPARCARITELAARDASRPNLSEVLDTVVGRVMSAPSGSPMRKQIARGVQHVLATRLMDLAAADTLPAVRAEAFAALKTVRLIAEARAAKGAEEERSNAALLATEVRRFLERPLQDARRAPPPPAALPGPPIGDACSWGG